MSAYPVKQEHLVRRTTFRDYIERQLAPILPQGAALTAPQAAALHEKLQELDLQIQGKLLPSDELWEWSATGSDKLDWLDKDQPSVCSGVALLRNGRIVRSWVILAG
jgi:hypothetical protein